MKNSELMMTTLACVLLGAYAEVVPMPDFSTEKVAGKWFLAGIATNAQWFVNHRANMKSGTTVMKLTEGGDLELNHANLNADGSCWRMTNLALKTETPGRFTFHNALWNNDNDLRFVDVVYDNYAVIHTTKTSGDVSVILNQLYSRTTETSDELKQKFTQFALGNQILAENIAILAKNDECPEV